MGGVLRGAASFEKSMDREQIRRGAEKYGVSYADYIAGVMSGNFRTTVEMQLDGMERQRREEERREAERHDAWAKDMQAKIAASKASYNPFGFINTSPPGYNGGTERCCGRCTYYGGGKYCNPGAPYEDRDVNASDSCGCWVLK